MSEKFKKFQPYLLAFVFILLLPNIFFLVSSHLTQNDYLEAAKESREECLEYAERDNLPVSVCLQIHRQAAQAYSAAVKFYIVIVPLLTSFIFALTVGIINLRKQLDALKEKINS